ncbi:MAG TPA: hypothetical protein VF799_09520 [Geobacteraceae bacterium]
MEKAGKGHGAKDKGKTIDLIPVSIRKCHNFPRETGRGFPEMNDTAFAQVLLTAGYAGIAGNIFDPGNERDRLSFIGGKFRTGSSYAFRIDNIPMPCAFCPLPWAMGDELYNKNEGSR